MDNKRPKNPHEQYNRPPKTLPPQTGEPLSGSKQVKQENHSRQVKTREG